MTEDLKTLAEIGIAIWGDPGFSRRTTLETMAAVSLLDLNPERAVERAAMALLERARNAGTAANTRMNLGRIGDPFYRLEPVSRFLLVALHLGRWSYARIARVLEETPERVQELAWSARMQIVAHAAHANRKFGSYPSGNGHKGPLCPEYLAHRPWTQRFLDEEIGSGADRLFLQNHLMACDCCRQTLNRCREMYFAVESLIPRAEDSGDFAKNLERTCEESARVKNRTWTVLGSLVSFLRKPENAVLALISLGLLFLFLRF